MRHREASSLQIQSLVRVDEDVAFSEPGCWELPDLQRPGFSGFVVVVNDIHRTKQIARFDCQTCNIYSVFVE